VVDGKGTRERERKRDRERRRGRKREKGRRGRERERDEEGKREKERKGTRGEERYGGEERAWRTGRSLRSSAVSSAATGRGDLGYNARWRWRFHGKANWFASDNGAVTASSSVPFPRESLRHPGSFHGKGVREVMRLMRLSDQMR